MRSIFNYASEFEKFYRHNIIINLKKILLVTQIEWQFERELIAKTNKIVHRLFKDTCKKLIFLKILTKDMPIS